MGISLNIIQEKIVRFSQVLTFVYPLTEPSQLNNTQFHADPVARAKLAVLGMPMNDYDGGVDLWARTLEDLIDVRFCIWAHMSPAVPLTQSQ